MFWESYLKLCNSVNKAPNVVAAEVGIKSSGTVTGWKNGVTPRDSVLSKLADYFGCTTSELLGETSSNPQKETSPNATVLSHLDADAIAVAEAYAQADEKSRAMVRLALNLDTDVPLAAHGGPSGKISAKTAEALEKGAVESTGDI